MFDNQPYCKSFMSLARMKDYVYMIIDNDKVLLGSFLHFISLRACGVAWHPTD